MVFGSSWVVTALSGELLNNCDDPADLVTHCHDSNRVRIAVGVRGVEPPQLFFDNSNPG